MSLQLAYIIFTVIFLIRHFIYCGSTIIHTVVDVDETHRDSTLTINRVKNMDNAMILDQFSAYVRADYQNMYELQKRIVPSTCFFSHLAELDNNNSVYIFQYRTPSRDSRTHQFSAITLTELLSHNIIQVLEETNVVPIASLSSSDHNAHYALELFRQSSAQVNSYFDVLLSSATGAGREDIKKAKQANISLKHPSFSTDCTEREWTERLYTGMQVHTPELHPKLTLDHAAGGGFEKNVLHVWSGLNTISATCVPLRGAPDITYDNKFVSVAAIGDDEGSEISDSSTSPVEITVGKSARVASLSFCPDKLGELSAALLTKAYCKFLRRLKKATEQDQQPLIVHGLYLNRPESEAIQCELCMTPTFISGSRRINKKSTQLKTVIQFVSSAGDLCKALHYNCHS